jgi:uncharacterized membrane protein
MLNTIYRPSVLTLFSIATTIAAISGTTGYILGRAAVLPPVLAVHFDDQGIADRWVPASYTVALIPVWIQLTLAVVFGVIALVLLYRSKKPRQAIEGEAQRQDRERMLITAEAVSLLAAIWVTFQGLSAIRLLIMWGRNCCGMGSIYYQSLVVAIVLSVIVGLRAAVYTRYPSPSPHKTDEAHWYFRALYFNRTDPALFVPLRDGIGWTLNFGRPRALVLVTVFAGIGVVAPLLVLRLIFAE